MITLTPYQQEAKKYIEWLLSLNWDKHGVGRSFLMCIIFIEQAMERPGDWIVVWDHGPYHPKKEEFLLRDIKNIVELHYPDWEFKIKHMSKAFCMRLK